MFHVAVASVKVECTDAIAISAAGAKDPRKNRYKSKLRHQSEAVTHTQFEFT